MIIAIPTDNNVFETDVSASFGRAPYYLIYDTETKESTFVDNSAAMMAGGAGVKAAQLVVDSKAEVLLTPRCGENAADVILAANIRMHKTLHKTAGENIEAFLAGELPHLDEIHAGHHGQGER
ncbi:MAG TPA: dinitrogenase iron-molybdenum cofactor biosynthesis protein [Clostridiales bacterium]|jgi:predicted Fe-Mo cluster-binding NifX family protein|nr:dinitrogenase iron-molybdenum cofactor biosynthesis protein [Clostridiales bacterium]